MNNVRVPCQPVYGQVIRKAAQYYLVTCPYLAVALLDANREDYDERPKDERELLNKMMQNKTWGFARATGMSGDGDPNGYGSNVMLDTDEPFILDHTAAMNETRNAIIRANDSIPFRTGHTKPQPVNGGDSWTGLAIVNSGLTEIMLKALAKTVVSGFRETARNARSNAGNFI